MSTDKRDEKRAILGELESIKDLLNEDEFADIPTLDDSLALEDIPVLTLHAEPQPLIEEPQPSYEEPQPLDEEPHIDAETYVSIDDADIPLLTPEQDDLPEQDNADTTTAMEWETVNQTEVPSVDTPDSDTESQAVDKAEEIYSELLSNIEASTELPTNAELDLTALEPAAEQSSVTDEQSAESEQEEPFSEPLTFETHESPQVEEPTDIFNQQISVAEETDSQEVIEQEAIQADTETATTLPPLSQAPHALPGQQSLFDHGDKDSTKKAAASAEEENHSPAVSEEPKPSKKEPMPEAKAQKPIMPKARGENPFLPKHIRDRLHTNKPLVDVIKEHPPVPEIHAHPTNHVVEAVLAEFMPKIEAELRDRLLKLADEGRLDEEKPL